MFYLSRHNLPNNLTATEISHWILKHLVQMGRNGVQISLTSIIFPILQFRNVPYLCDVLRLSLHADSIENDIVDDGLLKHGSRRFFFGHLLADWKPVDIRDGCLKKNKKKNKKNKKGWRKRKMSDGQNEIRHWSRRYFIVPDDQSGCEIPGLFAHRSHYKLKKLPPRGAIFSGNRWSCLLFISSFYSFFLFHVTLQWSFGSFSCESIKKF